MFSKFLQSHIISAWSSLATKSSSSSSSKLSCSPPTAPLSSSLFFCLSRRRVSSSLDSFFKTISTPFKETSTVGCIPTIDVVGIRTQTSPTLASLTPIFTGKNCPKYPSISSTRNFTFRSVIFGPKSTDADTLLLFLFFCFSSLLLFPSSTSS